MLLNDKRIFIVEDNVINRVIYQVTLMQAGTYIDFDRWGDDAVAKLNMKRHYDLIILDLMLSHGNNGYDIFEEIRKMPAYANTPIIAISAAEPSEAMARCQKLGFNGYISKPIDEISFPQQLLDIMNGESVWAGTPHINR